MTSLLRDPETRGRTAFKARGGSLFAASPSGHAPGSQNGFTLLELMISITLIGIIVLVIAGATRLGFRSVDTGEKKIESLERIRTSLGIIDCQIQSQVPLTYTEDDGSRKYYFQGSRDSMQFSTNYSYSSAARGYIIASYRVAPDERGNQVLYVSENSIGIENKTEAKLFDTFNEIYFEYFYKDPTAEKGEWVDQWTDETTIPEKVKIHLVSGAKDFSMIIPMRAKGSLTVMPSASSVPGVPVVRQPGTRQSIQRSTQ
ncbi:MAG: prepilin-type N-terminal cleavage/methylation domain-containing protein [Nitrospirae bacterium]|nr:prepilin-type N-terminal cleavage/methylation domain-containing protein [Nitrospirota bacterium]